MTKKKNEVLCTMSLESAEKFWKVVQASLPRIENGKLVGKLTLDDFIVRSPNPTLKNPLFPSQIDTLGFFRPSLIIWEPCLFWNYACPRMPCPYCSKIKEDGKKKISSRTNSNGWSSPRKVSDISDTTFIISKKYTCQVCRKNFLTTDENVLQFLPQFIVSQYPCKLTKRNGLSDELVDLIDELAVEVPMLKIESLLQSLHAKRYARHHLDFLLFFKYTTQANSIVKALRSRDFLNHPTAFPATFLRPPGRQYIAQQYLARSEKRRQFIDNQMGCIQGKSLLFDHTFKIAKYLKQYASSDRLFEAVGTVMNEYGQVMSQIFTPTTENNCIRFMLESLRARVGEVDCIYVDNCCKIRGFLTGIFGPSTKVVLDVYHLMDRILRTLSKRYPFYIAFARELSDCLFEVDEQEVAAAKRLLFDRCQKYPNRRMHGKKLSQINPNDPPRSFLKRNCRYRIIEVQEIKTRLGNLVEKYQNFSDPLPQRTISALWKQYNNHIKKNCIDDPYDLEHMYIERKGSIYRYHSKRGTSIMENYHRGLRVILSGTSAGTALVDSLLREYNYRHNQRAAWRNMEKAETIHYDLESLFQLNKLHMELFPNSELPYNVSVCLTDTSEKFGVRGASAAMIVRLGVSARGLLAYEEIDCDENNENDEQEEEDDVDLSDVSSITSFDCLSDSDPSDGENENISNNTQASPERIIRSPGVITDANAQRSWAPSSAQTASSLMNISRPILPVCNLTEQRVVEQLVAVYGNDCNQIATAFNGIAQISAAMTFKAPHHIEASLSSHLSTSTSSNAKNRVRKGRGGDRRSKKFRESKESKVAEAKKEEN